MDSQQVAAFAESPTPGTVAMVHDYLNERGGADRVVLEMASIGPEAPIYTSLYRPESTSSQFRDPDVRRSPDATPDGMAHAARRFSRGTFSSRLLELLDSGRAAVAS